MDPIKLKLEHIDFSQGSLTTWRLRRIFIGIFLFLYYTYGLIFFVALFAPVKWTEADFLFEVQETYHLWITTTFGFLGSIYFVTRTFIRTTQMKDLPVVWYLTRPLQGILMAIFVYFAFRGGQLAFYSGTGSVDAKDINVWSVSLLALLAGAFADEAFQRLYAIATGLFKPTPS